MTAESAPNVCVALEIDGAQLERVRRACAAARVVQLSAEARRLLREGAVIDGPGRPELDAALAEAEVLFSWARLPADLPERAPRLRWVQVASAGVDPMLKAGLLGRGYTVTNASGLHATPIAEFCALAMLTFAKGLQRTMRSQVKHEWSRFMPSELRGATCGILGLGAIGHETARLAKAFGMRVLATRRHPHGAPPPHVDAAYGPDGTDTVMAEADYVVLAVPLTPETRHLVDARRLALMKRTAVLVNIARGAVVDEPALVAALRDGRIAGAYLDVFAQEPLPADHPFWDMENVVVSPHISGGVPDYLARATSIFVDNLARYCAGQPLANVVNPALGY